MADKKISELTQVSALNNGDLVEVSQVNALAPSGYTSLKASMTDLGKKVNADIEYTTELSDFADKTPLGAIKETAKDKNIADEYDGTQTYNKGDVVIYKNTLYICTTNNTTGTWDATKWTATTIDNVIGDLFSLTTTVKSSLVGAVNEVNTAVGGLFKIQQFATRYSISANGKVNFDRSFITIPTGYSIGGIIEASTGQGSCALVSVRPTNTSQWAFEIVNTSSSSYNNQTFTISILFVRTASVN